MNRLSFHPWLATLLVLATLTATTPAAAEERVLVLPARGTDTLLERAGALAVDAVRRALPAAGYRAESPRGQVQDILRDCPEASTCARQLITAAGVRLGLFTTVWGSRGSSEARQVVVSFETLEGGLHEGSADVEGGDVGRAARDAFARALSDLRGENHVRLHITGAPEGAAVTLDGQYIGTLPLAHEIRRGGQAELVIAARGHRTERQTIQLDQHLDLNVALEPTDTPDEPLDPFATPGPRRSTEPTPSAPRVRPWYALALAGAGAALALTTVAITLPQLGCAETFGDGECRRDRNLGTGPFAAYLAIGGALLVSGLLWYAIGQEGSRTELGLGPTSVQLRTRF
ncbi:MAG: PEGA domain-containing protein [Myxococcales bacterium]|nr:PEGA domain-containing protein [Myxococcales bacterium]